MATSPYVKNILGEFEERKQLYEEFCATVHKIFEGILKRKEYKHQIFCRVKEPQKLEEKLLRKEREGKIYSGLDEIEDLAGLRVVFYMDSDIRKFIAELQKELDGEFRIEEVEKANGYKATHVIIRPSPEAFASDEEREKFRNLKCEVQLTSVLYHAWAEIEHDIVYKKNGNTQKLPHREYRAVMKGLKHVYRKYIKKAALEIEGLARKMTRRK